MIALVGAGVALAALAAWRFNDVLRRGIRQ